MSLRTLFLCAFGLCCLTTLRAAEPETGPESLPTLTVAVVRDGPSACIDQRVAAVKKETAALLRSKRVVTFREDEAFSADWSRERAGAALQAALDDPSVDVILLQGFFVLSEAAGGPVSLTKPCVGGILQDPSIGAPFIVGGRSTVPNLCVAAPDLKLADDVRAFHELAGFGKVLYASTDAYLASNEGGVASVALDAIDAELGIAHGFVPLGADAASSLAMVPEGTEAIIMFPPLRFAERAQCDAFIAGVNAKGVPTYAMTGESGVARGMLYATLPALQGQLARRIALNIEAIAGGQKPDAVATLFPVKRAQYVNVVTATEIGFDLPTGMLYDAVLLGTEGPAPTAEPLDLPGAVAMAREANYELRARRADTTASYEAKRQALSAMLPQVNAVYQYTKINDATARDSLGTIPRQSNSIGVGVSQMIYDDDVVTGYRIAGQDYEAAAFQEQGLEADVIQSAAVAYLRTLSAEAILAIARENLQVTRTNLDLARVRVEVGTAGPEEVYRFEAAEAGDRASVAMAESQVDTARSALNRVLGRDDLAQTWDATMIGLDSEYFDATSRRVIELMTSESRLDRFRLFSLREAMAHAPELEVADRMLAAQELSYDQAGRSFYVPSVGVNFDYLNTFQKDTFESLTAAGAGGNTPNDEWTVTLQASLPIFEGGNRVFNLLRQRALVRRHEYNRSSVRQDISQRVLDSLYALTASYRDVRFSRVAADRAQKNLDIVTEKYRVGRVNIVDLLDAQNEAYAQKQNESLATYAFLEDLVNYMRAINWFEFLATEQEQDDWIASLRAFVEAGR